MGAKTIGPGNRKYKHADKKVCPALPIWKWGKFKFIQKENEKKKKINKNPPIPNPITKTVIVSSATTSPTANSSATWFIPAVITLLSKATTKHVTATTIVMYHFRALLQFFGFSGSSSLKVTSSKSSIFPVAWDLTGFVIRPSGVSRVYSSSVAVSLRIRDGRSVGSIVSGSPAE
ncbi:hypothetical protein I7I50_05682 [Histoplasma capsulatum G186AR]|uniref:Uncharacterized protein n=1 Tax=Ajellomyces capsulatus TaxID=5037 RepID=A0A8H7ZCL7_AJECA|nr:hypothetical protein I7I52_03942 [Histoplasma capsulatum]QSS76286.1 hypothetical protein I7I50_05682 [Histoplasma capsulatum G186AR]